MAHKNYGAVSHTNSGYSNHTNINSSHNYSENYGQYHQSYNNHTNYGNHSNSGYLRGYSNGYNQDYSQHQNKYSNHENYFTSSHRNSGYRAYSQNHSQYLQSGNHTNSGSYSQSGYSNGHTQAYSQYKQSSGYNNHSNTGYTNHVNTTTNNPPTNVSNVSKGSAVYYKDSINLTWTAATDNNKCISCTGSAWGSHPNNNDKGIWENTIKVQGYGRGIFAYAWNSSGGRISGGLWDTYNNATNRTNFINWLNSVPNNSIIAIATHDAPCFHEIKGTLSSSPYFFTLTNNSTDGWDGYAGITQKNVGIKSQQFLRKYETNGGAVSASFNIAGVSSGQTISYYIDYCFKPIGGVYGDWTRIGTTTASNYNYNLSSHGNGHIKFRVLSTDGVENGSTWVESPEVRVLKYTAPSSWGTQEKVTASDFESLRLEINKLAGAVGTATSGATATAGNLVTKAMITDFRDKIKLIGPQISKTNPTDSNLDIIRKTDIDNLKNWLKEV